MSFNANNKPPYIIRGAFATRNSSTYSWSLTVNVQHKEKFNFLQKNSNQSNSVIRFQCWLRKHVITCTLLPWTKKLKIPMDIWIYHWDNVLLHEQWKVFFYWSLDGIHISDWSLHMPLSPYWCIRETKISIKGDGKEVPGSSTKYQNV